MKKTTILFILTIISTALLAHDKYFVLDLDSKDYKVVDISLHANKAYGKSIDIELYNLRYDKNTLILFSILPTVSKENWSAVNVKDLKAQIIDFRQLKLLFEDGFKMFLNSSGYDSDHLKRQDIILIIKKGDKYFRSENCITEYFKMIEQPVLFPNLMGNIYINTKSPDLSVKAFETRHKEIYKDFSVNAITSKNQTGSSSLKRPLERPLTFFSGSLEILGYKCYKFWQFTDWRVADGLNLRRGIDRFLYVPELGIIGGSFDSWFEPMVSQTVIFDHYMNEVLIIPESATDIHIH
ncbi:hypothetical protein DBR43_10420 [Pedobacter sp. KBW06]|uniref:hypothetical protein n=1 Tax=Pedobacter sp. KBW06 TaxID=2153359 RepID=UPI000F5A99DA|nr:hypothetical protein [Pedobacter sp. KBW06]RQO71657.1 hypothetical protein DBR43_10420 [Pedobacter sp. KBW06]